MRARTIFFHTGYSSPNCYSSTHLYRKNTLERKHTHPITTPNVLVRQPEETRWCSHHQQKINRPKPPSHHHHRHRRDHPKKWQNLVLGFHGPGQRLLVSYHPKQNRHKRTSHVRTRNPGTNIIAISTANTTTGNTSSVTKKTEIVIKFHSTQPQSKRRSTIVISTKSKIRSGKSGSDNRRLTSRTRNKPD